MQAGDWNEAHSALLGIADTNDPLVEGHLDATWEQIARRIDDSPRSKRRRRAVAVVAVSAVLAGGGTAAAAAADLFGARTGEFASSADVRRSGPGEFLRSQGKDFAQVTLAETADIPFPSEQVRAVSAKAQLDDLGAGDTQVASGALRGFVANDAICAWSNAFARAIADGDRAAAKAAASTLAAAEDWPAVRALDTKLSTRTIKVGFTDGTSRRANDPTRFYFLRGVQRAVKAGDVPALGKALHGNVFCHPDLMPDLPDAVPTPGRP